MNCLVLLIILFCCNGNGNCGNNNYGSRCCDGRNSGRKNSCIGNYNVRRDDNCDRTTTGRNCDCDSTMERRDCDCDVTSGMHTHTHTSSQMPRTKFPYLDVEPRTCGCEEKSES